MTYKIIVKVLDEKETILLTEFINFMQHRNSYTRMYAIMEYEK